MADIVPLSTRVEGPVSTLSMPGYARPIGTSGAPGSRGIQGILLRHLWLIAGCVAALVFIGAILTWRLTPIYSSSASLRIDEQPSNVQALDVLASLKGTEINTEIEVLGSRTLARAVVDSLGLQVQVTGPRGVLRSQVFPYVQPVRTQRPDTPSQHLGIVGKLAARFKGLLPNSGGYRLDRRPDGKYTLTNLDTKRQVGIVAPGDSLSLEGMRFVFAPTAGDALDHYNFSVLPTDIAVNITQGAINVSRPMPLANLALISYEDPDPELARDVPNELTALYLAQRHAVGREGNETTVKFLKEQIKQLSASLSTQEDSLRRFRESHQAVSLQDEATTGVQRLGDLRADRNKMEAERSALGVLLKNVKSPADSSAAHDASRYRYLMAFPTLLQNQAAAGLLQSLNEAEDKRGQLITKRTPADPDVQAIDARISALETQINGIATTYYNGLSDQVAGMDSAIANSQARLSTLPGKEVEENRLERQPKVLADLYTLLQTRLKEAEIAAASVDPTVHIVDTATLPLKPSRPKPILNLILAAAAGLLLGVAAAFVRESADKNIHSRADVQMTTRLPVLGLIPRIDLAQRRIFSTSGPWRAPRLPSIVKNESGGEGAGSDQAGEDADIHAGIEMPEVLEAFNRLAVNVSFGQQGHRLKVLVITSPTPGDGKTTVAVNLALAMAQRGRKVLLIDADLRRGRINSVLKTNRSPGLSEVLKGQAPVDRALCHLRVEDGATLDFLPSGRLMANPSQVLAEGQALSLLQRLEASYDLIILDTPPLNAVSDAVLLGASVGGVILVARSGVTATGALAFAMEQFSNIRANVIGTVLNDINFDQDARYDAAYRYYRYDPKSYSVSE